jgi:hypothetical protein
VNALPAETTAKIAIAMAAATISKMNQLGKRPLPSFSKGTPVPSDPR